MLSNSEREVIVSLANSVEEIVRRTPGATEIKSRVYGIDRLKAALSRITVAAERSA